MTQTLQKTDAELKSAVTEELVRTAGLNSANIGVAANDGAVTLSGEVESYPEKLRAEHAMLRVAGVTAFADEITVRGSSEGINDTDIARKAGEALDLSVDVPSGEVKAAVHDHAITLSGKVTWHYQRGAATSAVQSLPGVSHVNNMITIRPAVKTRDIKAAILSALLVRSAQIEIAHTIVMADDAGVVTLDGRVRSWSQRRAAEDAAWSAAGVTGVVNHLCIEN
jgi:osmotically-inducible protein OsmY